MATLEFRICEARDFWTYSAKLRDGMRRRLPSSQLDPLVKQIENHARYGVQSIVRQRALLLLAEVRDLNVRFG